MSDSTISNLPEATTPLAGTEIVPVVQEGETRRVVLAPIAVSGSAADLEAGTVPTARLGSGTANSATFLRGDGTWATPDAGGLADGDYGDVTVSAGGTAISIDADAVTFAKMQDIATDRLLGRSTAGSGNVEEITCTAAGRALLDDASASAQRTTLGLPVTPRVTVVRRTTDLSLTSGAFTVIAWDEETIDDAGAHDNVTNNSRLVVPAGYTRARLTLGGSFTNSATGSRGLGIMKNSGGTATWGTTFASMTRPASVESDTVVISEWVTVVEGDYFEAWVVATTTGQSLRGASPAAGWRSFFQIELANAP